MRSALTVLVAALILGVPGPAFGATGKSVLLGAYGIEQKYDVSAGRFEKSKYYGGILTIRGLLELQILAGTAMSANLDSPEHFSLSFHYAPSLFEKVEPFFNFGPGYLTYGGDDGFHLNFDVGLQLVLGSYRLRAQHKTQLNSWGASQFSEAVYVFALGMEVPW